MTPWRQSHGDGEALPPASRGFSQGESGILPGRAIIPTVAGQPLAIALTPDGRSAYVTNYSAGAQAGGTVSVIDTVPNAVTHTVIVKYSPDGVAITPDGRRAYVTEPGVSGVAVLDTGAGWLPAHGLIWL